MPEGVTGLDDTQVNIMAGAVDLGLLSIKDIYTPAACVQMLYLDSKFDQKTALQLQESGFSRVPIAFSREFPAVIAVLLVKTVLGVDHSEETIG